MTRKKKHHGLSSNPGRGPGTLTIPEGAAEPRVHVTRYSRDKHEARDGVGVAELVKLPHGEDVLWIEIQGYGNAQLFAVLEQHFGVPRLALEDVLSGCGRAKLDSFGDSLFVVARAAKPAQHPEFEQVSAFLRGRVLITFCDEPLTVLAPLRERLRDPESLTRRSGADFLLYRVLDSVVDTYVPCLEHLGARLDAVEADAIARASTARLQTLYELMRDVRLVMRVVLPMRDLASSLRHEAIAFFQPTILPFLSDLRDHTNGAVDLTAHYRDLAVDVRELIFGTINIRLNAVMRMLAAVTAIFVPLSFFTGWYGMNFEFMPEVHWRYAYFVALGVVALVGFSIFRWFQKRGWTNLDER
jgi:magnesium transporter